jgi:hypothetical protein
MGFAFGIVLPFAGMAIGIVRPCPQLDDWPCLAEASASGVRGQVVETNSSTKQS